MRTRSPGARHSVVAALVFINIAIFLAELLMPQTLRSTLTQVFGLSWVGLKNGMVWQLVSHQFLHGNALHVAVNMMGLWYAGRLLEGRFGRCRFLALYLTCGIVGGLFQVLISPGTLLIGASGAVFGVVCALSALYPEMRITALLFFVIPINLQAKWLGRGVIAFSLLMTLTGWGGPIGHAAHLGGALAGYAWGHLIASGRIFRRL